MKISIYSSYEIKDNENNGDYDLTVSMAKELRANTYSKEYKNNEELKSILDIHNEKVGALERILLK